MTGTVNSCLIVWMDDGVVLAKYLTIHFLILTNTDD